MQKIKGRYAEAIVYAERTEGYASAQIRMIADNEISKGSDIRIMPDVHPGKVGPIGLTMTVNDRVIPNLLGVDIGCGMLLAKVKTKGMEFSKLDKMIRSSIPSGFNIRNKAHKNATGCDIESLRCYRGIDADKAMRSLGTLGGGTHFIEIDRNDDSIYVLIHSGSRHTGAEVTEYYNRAGKRQGVPEWSERYICLWLCGCGQFMTAVTFGFS